MRTLKFAHSFEVVQELPEALAPLRELAFNFRWSWHLPTQELFKEADPDAWEALEHNPVQLVHGLSAERQRRLLKDDVFLAKLNSCVEDLRNYLSGPNWFDSTYPNEREKTTIAYFCAEFGLHESLPIYSGGLGVLAGDHLKSASDLGVPLIGVGLLYSRGYFRQSLSPDGWQQERYPEYDFYRMPLKLIRGENEQPLRITVEFPDRSVICQVWQAQVGRISLYLLDSNILENEAKDQSITDTLYGGDEEMRIRQEIILGVGGYRALTKLGIKPTVCHLNEGHAAFSSLERIRTFIEDNQCSFRVARQCVVAGNVFTTHTPVPAGFDIFQRELLESYVTRSVESVKIPFETFLSQGRIHPTNSEEKFNMAVFAMENSDYVNGVSQLHAQVSREMFADRWPNYPVSEVPIDGITNGIHTATWISQRMSDLLSKHFGPEWRSDLSSHDLWTAAANIPDSELWEMRENARGDFVRYCRRHVSKRDQQAGRTSGREILDPRALTIGFARRFATYKRATLLFTDKERLRKILLHTERPVQFVFAGKSHPRDDGGKKLIQDIQNFIKSEGLQHRMVFLEDYDMSVARELVKGVDVWLNNPRRPMEASGTSGMKVVPNGGLNCSILDGWWAEGYKAGLGWAIGDDTQNPDEGYQDWLDSQSLYSLIENEIAPAFYQRNDSGIPTRWVQLMRDSMKVLAPRFSTLRMVREYTSRCYVPASLAYQKLSADNQSAAVGVLEWRDRVRQNWSSVKINDVKDSAHAVTRLGEHHTITALVDLGSLNPSDVRVQIITGAIGANREMHDLDLIDMELTSSEGTSHTYTAVLKCEQSGHRGYVARVVPHNESIKVAAELPLAVWQQAPA